MTLFLDLFHPYKNVNKVYIEEVSFIGLSVLKLKNIKKKLFII
jgi:hypothetical protein